MLQFEHGAEFELTGVVTSGTNRLVRISGFTKERPFTFQIQTGSGFKKNIIAFRIPEIPIAIIVSDDSTTLSQNSVYVELNLSVEGTSFIHLLKGYLGVNQSLGWPDSPAVAPLQTRGQASIVASSDPAAGAEITQSIGASIWVLLKSLSFTLVTDGTQTDRRVALEILVANIRIALLPAPSIQAFSRSQAYTWADGASNIQDIDGLTQVSALPRDLLLGPGNIIRTVTTGLEPGDNFSAMNIYVQRYLSL